MGESDTRFSAVPFPIVDGWPKQLEATVLRACESGIMLGQFCLPGLPFALQETLQVMSIRIDEDPQPEEWTTKRPDGTQAHQRIVPPHQPVAVPEEVFRGNRALGEWVTQAHGSLGRVLLWGGDPRWWIVNEPDLETALVCGPPSWVRAVGGQDVYEPFSWIPRPSAGDHLRALYGL